MDSIVGTFSIQPDSQADTVCQIIKSSLDSALNVGTAAFGAWGQVPGTLKAVIKNGVSMARQVIPKVIQMAEEHQAHLVRQFFTHPLGSIPQSLENQRTY
jgi:hypothetical protein